VSLLAFVHQPAQGESTALVVNAHHQTNASTTDLGAVYRQDELFLTRAQGRQDKLGKREVFHFDLYVFVSDETTEFVCQARLFVPIPDFLSYLPELGVLASENTRDHLSQSDSIGLQHIGKHIIYQSRDSLIQP